MTGLASSGYLGEDTEKRTKRSLTVDEELDRRVLCMGFRCFFAAQSLFKRSKSFITFLRGEHNVCGSATDTIFRKISRS